MRSFQAILLIAPLLFAAQSVAEPVSLKKSLYELDDLYYAHAGSAKTVPEPEAKLEFFRKLIQFEQVADTVFVKVVVTIDQANQRAAGPGLRQLGLRAMSQFGNLFTAKMPLLVLPKLEELAYVERIEPVAPEGFTARASISSVINTSVSDVKKK